MGTSLHDLRRIAFFMNEKANGLMQPRYVVADNVYYLNKSPIVVIGTIFGNIYIPEYNILSRSYGLVINDAKTPLWLFGIKIPGLKSPFKYYGEVTYFYIHTYKISDDYNREFEILISEKQLEKAKLERKE